MSPPIWLRLLYLLGFSLSRQAARRLLKLAGVFVQAPLSTGQRSFLCLLPSNTSGDGKHTISHTHLIYDELYVEAGCLGLSEHR